MITVFSVLGALALILVASWWAHEIGFSRGKRRGAAEGRQEGRREGRSHERREQALRRLKSSRSWSFTTRMDLDGFLEQELIFGEDPEGVSWIARRYARSLSVVEVRRAVTGERADHHESQAFEAAFHAHLALRPSDSDWSDAEGDQPQ